MAKKNPAVLWNVDQTGDVIGAAGRQRAQKNIGITDGEGKLIDQTAANSFMTSITLDDSKELKAVFGRPTLADLTPSTANRSIGTNSSGGIEVQDLSNVTSSAETNPATGTTYVSSITQTSNGQVNYKTQTITEATDESSSSKKGITALTSDLYASNTRTTGNTTAVTPDGVWDAIDSLDVNNITGFGADKTLATLTETDGKISASFQSIAIGGGAVTLDNASQVVVTDSSKKLTTKDLTVDSSTDENATNKFVSTVTADSTGKITVKKANIAIDGTATTLDNASQAVVTDGSKHLTTEDLSVNTSTSGNATNSFVSSVTANAKGKISVTTSPLASATSSTIGGIQLGYTAPSPNFDKKYAVQMDTTGDNAGKAYVQVPWQDTHYTSSNIICSSSSGTIDGAVTASDTAYLNHKDNGIVTSSHQILGSGVIVTADNSGNLTLTSSLSTFSTYQGTSNITTLNIDAVTKQLSHDGTPFGYYVPPVISAEEVGKVLTVTGSAGSYSVEWGIAAGYQIPPCGDDDTPVYINSNGEITACTKVKVASGSNASTNKFDRSQVIDETRSEQSAYMYIGNLYRQIGVGVSSGGYVRMYESANHGTNSPTSDTNIISSSGTGNLTTYQFNGRANSATNDASGNNIANFYKSRDATNTFTTTQWITTSEEDVQRALFVTTGGRSVFFGITKDNNINCYDMTGKKHSPSSTQCIFHGLVNSTTNEIYYEFCGTAQQWAGYSLSMGSIGPTGKKVISFV